MFKDERRSSSLNESEIESAKVKNDIAHPNNS